MAGISRQSVGGAQPRGGFTIIELLVVIAIIAILASLLSVGASGGRKAALSAACRSNLKQLGTGMALFASDNDDRLPFPYTATGAGEGPWHEHLIPYLQQKGKWDGQIIYCPSAAGASRPIVPHRASYAMVFAGTEMKRGDKFSLITEHMGTVPATRVMIADSCRNGGDGEPAGAVIWNNLNTDTDGAVAFRHRDDAANLLFFGMNVEPRTHDQMLAENLYLNTLQ